MLWGPHSFLKAPEIMSPGPGRFQFTALHIYHHLPERGRPWLRTSPSPGDSSEGGMEEVGRQIPSDTCTLKFKATGSIWEPGDILELFWSLWGGGSKRRNTINSTPCPKKNIFGAQT